MDPVIGLDVAKGESQVQAFLARKHPFGKTFKFKHDTNGLREFFMFFKEVEIHAELKPVIVFESTGHYHEPILQFLEEKKITYYLVNPIVSYETKKSSLRKVKSDPADAKHLCEMYYKEDLVAYQQKSVETMNLRNLNRQHDSLTRNYVQLKLQFQTILDQVFPEYKGVFSNLYAPLSLKTLLIYPTSHEVLKVPTEELARKMHDIGGKRSYGWFYEKALKLKESAERNPFKKTLYQSNLVTLKMYIQMLLQQREFLNILEQEIESLAMQFEEYEILTSIPGIGTKIAATLISEIGDVAQFSHPKKLVAYAGIDPRVYQSGQFTATINRITKRGSTKLRQTLYTAVQCGLTNNRNMKIRTYYDKKRSEGKPHKVAIIACANKLLHWIYAILKNKQMYIA
ncbi:IS110 family transposase [Cytobacillus sp. IB215665]|uniref:IS110 family transposase n=1 Tax=Cytobacillus sp. IB215665 TaxID=3097357 RepID=UPI002A10D569|nr:IS110 family transposase [Cytobacillus sp. IB215665]MDX8368060.1 IS110 family transposase [Cytobacillus sp. IB215665]